MSKIHDLSNLLEKKESVPLGRVPDLLTRKDLVDKIDRVGLVRGKGTFDEYIIKIYKDKYALKDAISKAEQDNELPQIVPLSKWQKK